jgi:hypothetical protein
LHTSIYRDAAGEIRRAASTHAAGRRRYSRVVPRVSERDRAYSARIGGYKRRSHEEALATHLRRSLAARLDQSWHVQQLYAASDADGRQRREDDPSRFYDRARELGKYEP